MKNYLLLLSVSWSLNIFAGEPAFDREKYYGEPVKNADKLLYVVENKSQTHAKDQFVMIKVTGFKPRKQEVGRVRIAVWDRADNYGKEGVGPFRASSYWAKEAPGGVMVFKVAGFELGKKYAFFAHFDKNNDGKVNKILGIPIEPFIFSNTKNQGKGPGLSREGLSAPKFESTLVSYTGPGQEIILGL